MRRLELTKAAEIDLADLLDRSVDMFGLHARRRYEALIEAAFAELRAAPLCLGSLDRPDIGPGLRTYHLRHSRTHLKPRGAVVGHPRHLIAYEFDDTRLLVLRVLHDAMDITRHPGGGEGDA